MSRTDRLMQSYCSVFWLPQMTEITKTYHGTQKVHDGLMNHAVCNLITPFNPFPPVDAFWHNSSRRLLTTLLPKVKQLRIPLWRLFRFLSLCFQSCLLQICCMGERVKVTAFTYARAIDAAPAMDNLAKEKSDTRRNCSLLTFSLFATTIFNLY